MSRFFITGISGFVGCHLAAHLIAQGHVVTGLAHDAGGTEALRRRYGERFPASAVELCDIRDAARLRAALARAEPDGVFHLAAVAFVPSTSKQPSLAYEVNFLGAVDLLEAVRDTAPRARVVLVSSGEIYGRVEPSDLPIVETQELRPLSPYSVAKAAADLAGFQFFSAHALPVVRARPFNHTGPGQSPRFVCSEFARAVAAAECGKGPRRLAVGNLDVERDFSDVRDVVRGYIALYEKGRAGEGYNLGSGKVTSVRSILDFLLAESRVAIDVATDPAKVRPAEMKRVVGSIDKIRRDTGWLPEIPLTRTLADLLEYWRGALA